MGATLSDSFFDALSTSSVALEQAETLPPACYTDAAFYDFEKTALFDREWLCVGRADWVKAPGDYFTTQIVGEPIVVTHTREGEIKALSSVCQHRAMIVAEGKGQCARLRLPLPPLGLRSRRPGSSTPPPWRRTCNFDRKAVRLPAFKVEIWLGFIFINFHADAAPLAPRLEKVEAAIANYNLASAEGLPPVTGAFAWNWKVMFENNNDGYHASRLHAGPLHDFVPSELASFPEAEAADAASSATTARSIPTPASTRPRRRCCPSSPG